MVWEVFGVRAFWLYRPIKNKKWNWYKKPTTVVYDPLMYVFSQYVSKKDMILDRRDKFNSELENFYRNNYKSFEGRSTNLSDYSSRNNLFTNFVENTLGDHHEG